MRRRWLLFLLLPVLTAVADETVSICHGYGCAVLAEVRYGDENLEDVQRMLFATSGAENERQTLASVIGLFYHWAGEQTEIHNDRAGNFNDDNLPGRMDCIDHATTTTRLLRLLETRGYLRWHRVLEPEVRDVATVLFVHWSAVIEERESPGLRFAVDSWFVDNGLPAVILPLDEWKKGAGPDV